MQLVCMYCTCRPVACVQKEIPSEELEKICKDLEKAVSLGDENWMILEAVKKYCE